MQVSESLSITEFSSITLFRSAKRDLNSLLTLALKDGVAEFLLVIAGMLPLSSE